MSFVQLFTGSLIQLFLYTVKKTSCHCMQSCLSPHPSIEIFIYQRIYLKYSYLETFPGGAPLRVTYAEPKPPSWPTACPPPLTFPIVAPAPLSIANLPPQPIAAQPKISWNVLFLEREPDAFHSGNLPSAY